MLCKHIDRNETSLAAIQYFAECTAKSNDNSEQPALWVAAVSWYMPHDCAVWFGKHTQVWATVTFLGYSFVPFFCHIISRVLYTKADVNFGRVRGTEKVNITVPLNCM